MRTLPATEQLPAASKIDSSEFTELAKVIGWFIRLRWIACVGVFAALLIGGIAFSLPLPFGVLYGLTGLLCLINLGFSLYFAVIKKRNLSRRELAAMFHAQIVADYALLLLLVYFTGFLENPFAYFFVFHIMLTAFIFPADVVFVYVGALIGVFLGASAAERLALIPHFSLSVGVSVDYARLCLPRAAAVSATLAISAYLITSIKRRIAEKGRRVEVELDRYRELDRVKSNFILQVTHELRGPIAAMNGYHEMLLRGIGGGLEQRSQELVRKANRRTENLLQIIDEMIDYAYMKSEEEVRYTKSPLRLREVIDYQIELHATQASQKGIRLVSNCPRELTLASNRDLLNIILGNLINNALKYSPADTAILVNAGMEGGEVHLLVKDEGYGIEPEELDRIFEEFYRTRKARELERDGTGLGLSIVQRAVESLQGRLTVYSELNKGTTFHIFFPVGGEHGKDTDH